MSEPKRGRITEQHLLSEADFHDRLVQFFRPFVSVRPVDWSCVRESVTHFAPLFGFDAFSNLYFDYVFGLFEDFRITDRETICLYFTGYIRFNMYLSFKLVQPTVALQVCGSYFSLVPRFMDQLPSANLLYHSPSVVRRILRYLEPLITECKDFHQYVVVVARCLRNDHFVLDNADSFRWESVGVRGRRLQLIVMAVYFVLRARHFNQQSALEGFGLLFFEVIPNPHVTWQEISGFLAATYSSSESVKHSFIESFRESCKLCFPKCMRVLEPRSLKHLARCEVRRCLNAAHTLPHGFGSLGLPRELEDYVLLQRRKDQFRPVIPPLSRERVFAVPEIQSQETLDLVRIVSRKRHRTSAFSSSSSSYRSKKRQH